MSGLAYDRAPVRAFDVDGRLHVRVANLSIAAVNGYVGREIPQFERLGLSPGRMYQLLRDPDELAAAARSFNNVPLLSRHAETSADEPHADLVVGSTGTDAAFTAPFLQNSLVIWDAGAIAGIETEAQRELSCGYRYSPDFSSSGTFEGQRYDGVMRKICGNHLALVVEGRAGPQVVVGDNGPRRPSRAERDSLLFSDMFPGLARIQRL